MQPRGRMHPVLATPTPFSEGEKSCDTMGRHEFDTRPKVNVGSLVLSELACECID